MAVGIKVIYSIKNIFPEKTRSALLNALVLSHLHYPIVLWSVLKKSLRVTHKVSGYYIFYKASNVSHPKC